jgi:hypothetical protein
MWERAGQTTYKTVVNSVTKGIGKTVDPKHEAPDNAA